MSVALSLDLRTRVVAAYQSGGLTYEQLAEQFQIGRATVSRYLRAVRERGTVAPKPHAGGHPRSIDAQAEVRLRSIVRARPDATLAELAELLCAQGVRTTDKSVFRALERMGLSRKKRLSLPPSGKASKRAYSAGTTAGSASSKRRRG